MVKTVYLPKAEMERLSAAIAKPTHNPVFFIGAHMDSDDNYAELRQIVVMNGLVFHYRNYASAAESFDEVQVGVFKSLTDNSILIQYEDDYESLAIKEYTEVLFRKEDGVE